MLIILVVSRLCCNKNAATRMGCKGLGTTNLIVGQHGPLGSGRVDRRCANETRQDFSIDDRLVEQRPEVRHVRLSRYLRKHIYFYGSSNPGNCDVN